MPDTPSVPPPSSPPASAPAAKPPTLPSKKGLFLTILGLGLFLLLMVFFFIIVLLLQNPENNPILGALGVEPTQFKLLLNFFIGLVLGFLSLISLIVFLVGLFRRFTAAPVETDKRKSGLIMAGVSFLLLVFFVFVWIMLYFYVSQLSFGTQGEAVILTDPPDTLNLTAPVSINFTAREIEKLYEGREGVVSYAWDLDGDKKFDDGNGRDIQFSYETRGNADGKILTAVKISLGTGKEVMVEKLVTIANVLPKISVSYSPQVLEIPVEVTFNAGKSKDLDGNIISYEWDFDEDQVTDAKGVEVKRQFTEAKQVTVVLTVTDNNGEKAKENILLDLKPPKEKKAIITVRPGVKGQVPFKVSLDGTSSFIEERIQRYEWDFGDGSSPTDGRTVTHEYTKSGEYTVKLVVEGESGKRFEGMEKLIVGRSKTPPTAVIGIKGETITNNIFSGKIPLKLQLTAEKSFDLDGKVIEYRWDLNHDDVPDVFGKEAEKGIVVAGTEEISLIVVDDDDLTAKTTLTIKAISTGLAVDLRAVPVTGPVPLTVDFDASSSRAEAGSIISYTWNFGDKTSELIGSAKQSHQFLEVGEYTVTVTVLTDKGKRDSKTILIVVREIELQADFSMNPKTAKAGEKVFFDASASQGEITRYYFEFGDGQISRVVKPEHIYERAGTYTAVLEVYDRKGRVSRKEVKVGVE